MKTLFLSLLLFWQGAQSNPQHGRISGRVLTPDGMPAINVLVGVVTINTNGSVAGMNSPDTVRKVTSTDSTGHYSLEDIRPGRYYLFGGLLDAPTFYPGTSSRAEGIPITVNIGTVSGGLDFRLTTTNGLRLSGRIIREGNTSSQPGRGIVVLLNGNGQNTSLNAAPDGSFEGRGLRSGTYQLSLSPSRLVTPIPVVLLDKDITGFQVVVPASVSRSFVTGTLSVEGGGLLPNVGLRFFEVRNNGRSSDGNISVYGRTFTGSQGLPPGEYRVIVEPVAFGGRASGYSVKSFTAGSIDLLTQTLKVAATDSPHLELTLNVVSPPPWVKVSGRVTGLGNASARPTTIGIAGGLHGEPVFAPIQADGSFEFPMVFRGHSYVATLIPNSDPFSRTLAVGETDVTNIEFPAMISVLKVSGRVTNEAQMRQSGQLAADELLWGMLIDYLPDGRSTNPANPPKRSRIAADGSFEFPSVPPGRYQLTFGRSRAGSDLSIGIPGGMIMEVGDKDVTGLQVTAGR